MWGWSVRRLAVASVMAVGLALVVPGRAGSASTAPSTVAPLAPTSVKAVSFDGARGVLVTWEPPPPEAGTTVLSYVAYTYNRQHVCRAPATGPFSCVLTGLNGNGTYPIRVRALTTSGLSQPARASPTVIHPGSGNASPAASSSPAITAAPPTPSPVTPPAGSTDTATSAPSAASSQSNPTELPFTGFDLATMALVGLGLVAAGLLLAGTGARRRRAGRRAARWLYRP